MEMQYRLNQERLLAEHKLSQEILIHCIARLNKKINMLYGKTIKRQAHLQRYPKNDISGYALLLQNEIDDYIAEQNRIKSKRQTILHLLMNAYRLSLDDMKHYTNTCNDYRHLLVDFLIKLNEGQQ